VTSTEAPQPWSARLTSALTHRNFRLLWFAALGSTVGTWMQKYAQSWLVWDLTESNTYLGLDEFLSQLPILLFMLIGGVVADRHDRRRLLTGSQYVQAFTAFALALLVFTGTVRVEYIFVLSFITGCGQAFGGPAYQALIPSLVPRRDLPNAIALNSTQFNLSRVLGPAAGGAVVFTLGAAWCFTLNGLSYFLVVLALASLHLPAHVPHTKPRDLGHELRGGLRYVRETRVVYVLTVLAFVSTYLAMPVATLLPSFATDVLEGFGSPRTRLWMLMACQGLGAIVGALFVGSRTSFQHRGRIVLGSQIALGLLVAGFALSRWLPLSLILLFASGVASMVALSTSLSVVQLIVPDELRGRVVSIYMVALRSGMPVGSLVAGALADLFTPSAIIVVNGVLLCGVAGFLLARKHGTLQKV
jgi:MFS family permease